MSLAVEALEIQDLEELKLYMIERPVIRFERKATTSTDFETVLSYRLTSGILGISYLLLSVNPDLNGNYRVKVGRLLQIEDSPISAVLSVELPRTEKIYKGIEEGEWIVVEHRSPKGTQIVTEAFLTVVEVDLDTEFLGKMIRKPYTCSSIRSYVASYAQG
jgi:hypothetical protein